MASASRGRWRSAPEEESSDFHGRNTSWHRENVRHTQLFAPSPPASRLTCSVFRLPFGWSSKTWASFTPVSSTMFGLRGLDTQRVDGCWSSHLARDVVPTSQRIERNRERESEREIEVRKSEVVAKSNVDYSRCSSSSSISCGRNIQPGDVLRREKRRQGAAPQASMIETHQLHKPPNQREQPNHRQRPSGAARRQQQQQ